MHRTFQEYFAAAHIYERYQQEEDPGIIREFLRRYLHEPHWNEVLLLLFGKLGRKPATKQLRLILEGKHGATSQNVFFISSCLMDEVPVENDLAEAVIPQLSAFLTDISSTEGSKALDALCTLTRTRQYPSLARQSFQVLVTQSKGVPVYAKLTALLTLSQRNPIVPEDGQLVAELLLQLAQRSDLPIDETIHALEYPSIFQYKDTAARQLIIQFYWTLLQRPKLALEQQIGLVLGLSRFSPKSPEAQQVTLHLLPQLTQNPELSAGQASLVLFQLYQSGSLQQKTADRLIMQLAHRPDLFPEEALQVAMSLNRLNVRGTTERQTVIRLLSRGVQHPDLPTNQVVEAAQVLYQVSPMKSLEERMASRLISQLTPFDTFSLGMAAHAASQIARLSSGRSDEQQVIQSLLEIAKDKRFDHEPRVQAAAAVLSMAYTRYFERLRALQIIFELLPIPEAKQQVEAHWQPISQSMKPEASDIPLLSLFIHEEILPNRIHEELFKALGGRAPHILRENEQAHQAG